MMMSVFGGPETDWLQLASYAAMICAVAAIFMIVLLFRIHERLEEIKDEVGEVTKIMVRVHPAD